MLVADRALERDVNPPRGVSSTREQTGWIWGLSSRLSPPPCLRRSLCLAQNESTKSP